jgi:tripartite-type tricarboxylate transporter receptor subunit TctC
MRFLLAILMIVMPCTGIDAHAQAYPTKPIRLIVPYPPGGGTDIVARLLSLKLTDTLGQQVVIDNRGGANAIIGTELGAKSPPDGYTLLFALPANVAVNPSLYANLPYDPIRDFAPIAQLNTFPMLLVAHPSLPVTSVSDLVQLARSRPGQLNFASSGEGGGPHLAMELLKSMTKTNITHIPYKGGGPATNDLIAGQVQVMTGTLMSTLPFVKANRLRALGVTSARRSQAAPDIPAVGETLKGYDFSNWHGILAPRGTPAAIVEKLSVEIRKILQSNDVRERLASQGAEPVYGNPDDFMKLIKSEMVKYQLLLNNAGIRRQ